MPSLKILVTICAAFLLGGCAAEQDRGPVVLAAASLQEALEEAAEAWTREGHPPPVLSFAATPAIARQAASGAPADIVITADARWMDWLEGEGAVRAGSRTDLVGNTLVVVRTRGSTTTSLSQPGEARLALAEPDSVPAGRYARAALQSLGLWERWRERVVPAENVRAALALVERGEVELGVVYASDALASEGVEQIAILPDSSHPPIRYPMALLAGSGHRDAQGFAAFLRSGKASAIFVRHGFQAL